MAKAKEEAIPVSPLLPVSLQDKQRALDLAISGLQKELGDKNVVMNLGSHVGIPYPHLVTGISEFDRYALGIGGFARGRIIEIFGPEGGGKTTLALAAIAAAQANGELAAFVDAEHSLDPRWAKRVGCNVDNLLVSQPDCGEDALTIVEALVRSGALGIAVVDSVSMLVPRAELNGDMGAANVGLQARLMSQAMRKLASVVSQTNTVCIFINQIREKIGVMFGSPETTSGGRALRFAASVRVDVRKVALLKDGDQPPYGHRNKIKVVKNKLSPPFRECEVDLLYESGYDREGSLIDYAVRNEVIDKSGSWYSFKNDRIGQGMRNASAFLKENPEFVVKINAELDKALKEPQKVQA